MANRRIVDIILQETPEHILTVSNKGGKGNIIMNIYVFDFDIKAAYSTFKHVHTLYCKVAAASIKHC